MNQTELLTKLADIIYQETGYSPETITLGKTFSSLDIDSLSMLTILVNSEDAFGVKLVDTPAMQLDSIGELVEFIMEQQK